MQLDRRSALKGIGAAGATLFVTGVASANDGRARYIARTAEQADVESAGFDVLNVLAGGEVLLVTGPEDAVDDLEAVDGVTAAVRDLELEIEPVIEDEHDEVPDDPDDVYDELLWDKQVQDVREAQAHATGEETTVAIIDTGVDETHPDLSNLDVDASAAIVDGEVAPHEGDPYGHGTHVAGTAAATGDELMTGTAPDATLVSIDVLGYGTSTFGDIMVGMEYAAAVGADAANISLGFMVAPEDFSEFDTNVGVYRRLFEPVSNYGQREGTLYVGSAGNDETDLQDGWLRLWNGLSGVIGVSATGPNEELTFYSNWGRNDVDVGAPGGGYETLEKTLDPEADVEWPYPLNLVFSTYSTQAEEDPAPYNWLAGTSMAAPQVTGLAALARELDEDANPQQVLEAIRKGAEVADDRGDSYLGAGRVNALNTVERIE
ncbi:Subtilase family protein [Halobiforma haloterrestris]|uniref:Subtilase family protein n=1 Tax=Natronobacterium haloterrestre TaxID=148448 RepID=A0A1I1J4I8_NATHA|nr:S8 family serine peptidase [Halobiforma haloterrestris]SFC43356.1 Subtilase family protein [Halobiforma haloterrestris]